MKMKQIFLKLNSRKCLCPRATRLGENLNGKIYLLGKELNVRKTRRISKHNSMKWNQHSVIKRLDFTERMSK